jgi:hypothetical protein
LTLLAAMTFLGGCMQAFAWTVAQFAPPRKVKPVTELPKDKTILVYVECPYPMSYEPIKGMLTDEINLELLTNKVAGKVILHDRLLDAMSNTDGEVSKQEIGRMLHADLVLCVEIPAEPEGFSVRESEDSPLWQGRMKVNLKIIDVAKAKKLWPLDQLEYPVPQVELPQVADTSPTYGHIVAKALAIKTARRITKLFYEHTVPNTGPED